MGPSVVKRDNDKENALRGLLSNLEAELEAYLDGWRRGLGLRRRSEASAWRGRPLKGPAECEQRRR
jgi:hypothetical protein